MRTLLVEIPDETAAQLERAAAERGLTVAELLRETLEARATDFSHR